MEVVTVERVAEAVRFAKKAHAGQVRKGSGLPYFVHLAETMEFAKRYGAAEPVLMAAVLHDAVEDAGVSLAEMAARFGPEVAAIVAEVTEPVAENGNPRPPYHVRKAAYLEAMRRASPEAAMVAASDKLSNVGAILREHRVKGEAVFRIFKAGKAVTVAFYRSVAELLKPKIPAPMAVELERVVEELEAL